MQPVMPVMARLRFPHPLTLLTACIFAGALLSYLVPAGRYDRRQDTATGRQVAVAGSYHRVERAPVGPFGAFVAVPKGLTDAGPVVFLVFLVGGAFTIVDETGALRQAVGWLARRLDRRETLVIPIVSIAFALAGALENMAEEIIAAGSSGLGWDFDQMSGLFLAMGVAAGLVGGLGVAGTAAAFVTGLSSMAYAAMVVGFARAIFVVLDEGRIIDTIVHGLVGPLQHLPVAASAIGMLAVQAVVHAPVPSVSGQAVLTMPVLVPISDLIGLSRQVTVLAYQCGAGLTELVTPTNGALMAVTAAAGVRYGDWLAFAGRLYAILLGLGAMAVMVAIAIRW